MSPVILTENPTEVVPQDSSYIRATYMEEPPSLATLIDDSAYYSTSDLTLPTEAVIEAEIGVSASFSNPPYTERCDCISFIKFFYSGLQSKQLHYPTYLWRNFSDYSFERTEPIVGALVILKTDFYEGHIAVITSVSENSFEIIEKNWKYCQITTRSFEFNNEKIVGFLR